MVQFKIKYVIYLKIYITLLYNINKMSNPSATAIQEFDQVR